MVLYVLEDIIAVYVVLYCICIICTNTTDIGNISGLMYCIIFTEDWCVSWKASTRAHMH